MISSPTASDSGLATAASEAADSTVTPTGADVDETQPRLFHKILTAEESYQTRRAALSRINIELAAARQLAPNDNDEWVLECHSIGHWSRAIASWRQWAFSALPTFPIVLPARDWRTLLASYSPIALVEGCWLQYSSGPATSHTRVASELLRSHSLYAGYGNPTLSVGNRYRDLLRSLDISLPALGTWELVNDARTADAAWRMSEFELALSLYPRRYLPELLGYNLFKAFYAACPVIDSGYFPFFADGAATGYFQFHRSPKIRAELCACASGAIEIYLAGDGEGPLRQEALDTAFARLQQGVEVAKMLTEHWLGFAARLLSGQAFTPAAQMMALIRSKAHHALGYHMHPRLNGRSVDSYLAAGPAEALIEALAKSPFVRPGDARQSSFLTRLVAFGGPMFRIFTPEEIETIASWIDSLRSDEDYASRPSCAPTTTVKFRDSAMRAVLASIERLPENARPAAARPPLRELYYRLLHVESFPDILPEAALFAERWLVRSRSGLYRDERRLPFPIYTPTALTEWLEWKHQCQVKSYSGTTAQDSSRPSREDVIHESLQLCPMVFIDGAWLRWASAVQISHTSLGALLYQIYADELGNGDCKKNHPNVYRELMSQMGVRLPSFPGRQFAWWEGFEDASFEVPTFWLAISHFPNRFLPELLGLNLAMELSGVGGSYRAARDQLRRYGFSSAFVDLHNSIDNISTGHTALALKAITLHLDEIARACGPSEVQRTWLRIWTGYRALKPPARLSGHLQWACHRLLAGSRSSPDRQHRH